jgi:broad specificity phosphatase PhoE
MQQLRQADYHPEWTVSWDEAESYKDATAAALAAWRSIENSDEAIVFLFASLGVLKFR